MQLGSDGLNVLDSILCPSSGDKFLMLIVFPPYANLKVLFRKWDTVFSCNIINLIPAEARRNGASTCTVSIIFKRYTILTHREQRKLYLDFYTCTTCTCKSVPPYFGVAIFNLQFLTCFSDLKMPNKIQLSADSWFCNIKQCVSDLMNETNIAV